jgi:hypothetical protein
MYRMEDFAFDPKGLSLQDFVKDEWQRMMILSQVDVMFWDTVALVRLRFEPQGSSLD